jgi:DNA-binding beta-propeller fold protein YncE
VIHEAGGPFRRAGRHRWVAPIVVTALGLGSACGGRGGFMPGAGAPGRRPPGYVALVANEASDVVSEVGFTPGVGASVIKEIPVGVRPNQIELPHGLRIAPDGETWYVTLARAAPRGAVWKLDARSDTLLGEAAVGQYPEAIGITPDGRTLFVTEANVNGPPSGSVVTVVYAPTMAAGEPIAVCPLPRGNRLNADGTQDYVVCGDVDELLEIDTRRQRVSGRFSLRPGAEGRMDAAAEALARRGGPPPRPCSPSWVWPARGDAANRLVYVACNGDSTVVAVDVGTGGVAQRMATPGAPLELGGTPDGKLLVVTLPTERAVALFDLQRSALVRRMPTSGASPHGVAVTGDGRYAFVTNEGSGSMPGTVDVFDLQRQERVATTGVRFQPGPVDVWKGFRH